MKPIQLAQYVIVPAFLATGAARADEPPVGTVRTLPVVSVSLAVGSLERESKRVVYAPPPGWYVRSHRVVSDRKHGVVTYTVNTVPAGWNWLSDERSRKASRSSAEAMVATVQSWAGGKASTTSDSTSTGRQANTSSHHVLVVDVSAKGEGLFCGGGGVELTVYAEMVYLGDGPVPDAPVVAVAR
ncbi:MAG TPA: hypothetical protein VM533_11400 [Fimbriiglobus sp.]|nr:hypothetical protein [Fimbriiglobus sp.]